MRERDRDREIETRARERRDRERNQRERGREEKRGRGRQRRERNMREMRDREAQTERRGWGRDREMRDIWYQAIRGKEYTPVSFHSRESFHTRSLTHTHVRLLPLNTICFHTHTHTHPHTHTHTHLIQRVALIEAELLYTQVLRGLRRALAQVHVTHALGQVHVAVDGVHAFDLASAGIPLRKGGQAHANRDFYVLEPVDVLSSA